MEKYQKVVLGIVFVFLWLIIGYIWMSIKKVDEIGFDNYKIYAKKINKWSDKK